MYHKEIGRGIKTGENYTALPETWLIIVLNVNVLLFIETWP